MVSNSARKPFTVLAASAAVSLLAAGCGGTKHFANKARGPAPVTIAASVSQGKINLSPPNIGAGPITLSVANLSQKTVAVKLEPVDGTSGRASSGPINPQGTAELNVEVKPGSYRVSAKGGAVTGADLRVGTKRKSSQNDLLLP